MGIFCTVMITDTGDRFVIYAVSTVHHGQSTAVTFRHCRNCMLMAIAVGVYYCTAMLATVCNRSIDICGIQSLPPDKVVEYTAVTAC